MTTAVTITDLKRNLRESIKPIVSFRRGENCICANNSRESVKFERKDYGVIARISLSTQKKHRYDSSVFLDHVRELVTFLEGYARLHGDKYVVLKMPEEFNGVRFLAEDHPFLAYEQTHKLPLFRNVTGVNPYVRVLDESWYEQVLAHKDVFECHTRSLLAADSTMQLKVMDATLLFQKYSLYFEGFQDKIELKWDSEMTFISDTFGSLSFRSPLELIAAFNDLLSKIHKKQRIGNLYTPPRFHFDRFARNERLSSFLSEQLYGKLCAISDAAAVEVYFAGDVRVDKLRHKTLTMIVFVYHNHIIAMYEQDQPPYVFDRFEPWVAHLHQFFQNAHRKATEGDFEIFEEYIGALQNSLLRLEENNLEIIETERNCTMPTFEHVHLYKLLDKVVVRNKFEVRVFGFPHLYDAYLYYISLCATASCDIYMDTTIKAIKEKMTD
jgi:hypothetical protein